MGVISTEEWDKVAPLHYCTWFKVRLRQLAALGVARPSCKRWPYPILGVATAVMMYIPLFSDMTPCGSVRVSKYLRESYCFPLLHLE